MKSNLIIISIGVFLCTLGCQTAQQPPIKAMSANNIPDWLRGEPKVEGMICAIGSSGPTFYKDDAKAYAAENARKELAKTIQIRIESILIDFSAEKGSSIDEATVAQVTSSATSAVVENSKVIDYWYDEEGIVSNQKNFTFALCCMPRKVNKSILAGGMTSIERRLNQDEMDQLLEEVINDFK